MVDRYPSRRHRYPPYDCAIEIGAGTKLSWPTMHTAWAAVSGCNLMLGVGGEASVAAGAMGDLRDGPDPAGACSPSRWQALVL